MKKSKVKIKESLVLDTIFPLKINKSENSDNAIDTNDFLVAFNNNQPTKTFKSVDWPSFNKQDSEIFMINIPQLSPNSVVNFEDVFDIKNIWKYYIPHTTAILTENEINANRLKKLENEFSEKLIKLITESEFEYGYYSDVDKFIKQMLMENASVTREWLNHLFIRHIDNPTVTLGILKAISHIDYDNVLPVGPIMAMAALTNKNPEIREGGIRAFENWGSTDSIKILKTIKCDEDWLEEYLLQVIKDLEGIK